MRRGIDRSVAVQQEASTFFTSGPRLSFRLNLRPPPPPHSSPLLCLSYMIVCGNTSTGVYKDNKPTVRFDVSQLGDLQKVNVDSSGLTVGSGVTLAKLIAALKQSASKSKSFDVLVAHLEKVANTPVRAVGSWAGNLMMAHDHDDFPSDVATIMAGAGAIVTIGAAGNVTKVRRLLEKMGPLR